MSIRVEYSTNNSGGRWWLGDDDWRKLEVSGWEVVWGGLWFCNSRYSMQAPAEGAEQPHTADDCPGHRRYASYEEAVASGDRWLGGLATEASKEFASVEDAIREFESITGQDASAEGCNCCGPPHSFSWINEDGEREWASGEDVLSRLYRRVPGSLREAARLLNDE